MTNEARNWAALCHAAALLGLFPLIGFGHIVGPLIVWLVKRNDHPYIDEHGKESINFQISVMIYSIFLICIIIGIPLLIVLAVTDVVLVIMAAIKASNGEMYRYPFCLRLIK
ncbi:MAG: DUF4870 domain-containing protein [Planctomycetia bacterium]|nr:DUF4870 domain-containing protein [Planctomycetia bacterium]